MANKRTPEPFPTVERVVGSLLAYLENHGQHRWQIQEPVSLRQMPWSTLYFIKLRCGAQRRDVVAKIAHFPSQSNEDNSWRSEELLLRGRREYASLTLVYNHFQDYSETGLRSVEPVTYLPDINAVVMEHVVGVSLYDACWTPPGILRPGGLRRAARLLFRSGQWLRWLHTISVDKTPADRVYTTHDCLAALVEEAGRLREFQIHVEGYPDWWEAMDLLECVEGTEPVSCHGDFHLRNMFVLPDGDLLGMDIALERVESPYFDIGKMVADLKTRKLRILMGGLVPSDHAVRTVTDAFLRGYFQDGAVDAREQLLFEGRFILQKWRESLEAGYGVPSFVPRAGVSAGLSLLVNPTFKRILCGWLNNLLAFRE